MIQFTLSVDASSDSDLLVQAIQVSIQPPIPGKPVSSMEIRIRPGESKLIAVEKDTSIFIRQSIHETHTKPGKP